MLDPTYLEKAAALQSAGTPFCVVTIVDARGSVPQIAGARAIFTGNGLKHGTVGGGNLEAKCRATADDLLTGQAARTHLFFRWNMQTDLHMTCGGEVAVFFETHRPEHDWNIVIFGAGHVAQTLVRFLLEFECRVLCVDSRREWLDKLPSSPRMTNLGVSEFAAGVAKIPPKADVVVMTMGHQSDLPVLKEIALSGTPPAYLGVIGSKSKAVVLRRELAAAGVGQAFISALVCPIGEKTGNNTPAEIALGIVSQLVKRRRAGRPPDDA